MPVFEIEPAVMSSSTGTIVLEAVRDTWRLSPLILGSGRHTLGSDAACDHVIAAPGVAARHALIVVGPQRTIVKALSPLTWINDGSVQEGTLHAGDRLILGPIEFRVRLADEAEITLLSRRSHRDLPESPDVAATLPAAPAVNAVVAAVAPRRALELDAARTAAELAVAEAARREALNRELLAELQAEVERTITLRKDVEDAKRLVTAELQSQQRDVEGSLRTAQTLVADREATLDARLAQLDARDRTLADREQTVDVQLAELQRQQADLEATRRQLEIQQRALTELQAPAAPDPLQARLTGELRRYEIDLDARWLQLADRERQLAQQRQTFDAGQKSLDERLAELGRREQQIAQRERELAEQSAHLTASAAATSDWEQRVSMQAESFSQERAHLDETGLQLRERAEQLAARETALTARIQELSVLEAEALKVEEAQAELEQRSAVLDERQAGLDSQEELVAKKLADVNRLSEDLNQRANRLSSRLAAVDQAHAIHEQNSVELERSRTSLNSALSTVERLEAELSDARETAAAYVEQLAAVREELSVASRQQAMAVAARQQLEADFLRQKVEHDQIQREYHAGVSERRHAEEVLRSLDDHLVADRSARDSQAATLAATVARLQDELRAEGAALVSAQASRAQLEQELAAARQSVTQLSEQFERQARGFRREQEYVATALEALEGDLLQDREQRSNLQATRAADMQSLEAERASLRAVRQRLTESELASRERTDAALAELAEQREEIRRQQTELAAQAEAVQRSLSDLESQKRDLAVQFQEAADRAQSVDQRVTKLQEREAEIADLQSRLSAEESLLNERDRELSQKYAALSEREEDWRKQSLELRAECQRVDEDGERLRQQAQDLAERARRLVEREQGVGEALASITAREESLAEREAALLSREATVSQREQAGESLPAALSEAMPVNSDGVDVGTLIAERDALRELRSQLSGVQEQLTIDQRIVNRDRARLDESLAQYEALRTSLGADQEALLLERQSLIMERQEFECRLQDLTEVEARIQEARQELEQERLRLEQLLVVPEPAADPFAGEPVKAEVEPLAERQADSADEPASDVAAFDQTQESDETAREIGNGSGGEAPAVGGDYIEGDASGGDSSAGDPDLAEAGEETASVDPERASILARYGFAVGGSPRSAPRVDDSGRSYHPQADLENSNTASEDNEARGSFTGTGRNVAANGSSAVTGPAAPEVTQLRSHLSQLFGFSVEPEAGKGRVATEDDVNAHVPEEVEQQTDDDLAADPAVATPSVSTLSPTQSVVALKSGASAPAPASVPAPTPAPAQEPEEDSVAAYMERLLARTRRTLEPQAESVQPAAPPPEPVVATQDTTEENGSETSEETVRAARRAKPEDRQALRATIDSMREVSNQSSRAALAKHAAKKLEEAGKIKLLLLTVSAVLALFLLLLSMFTTTNYWISASLAVTLSIIVAMDALRSRLQLRKVQQLIKEENAAEEEA